MLLRLLQLLLSDQCDTVSHYPTRAAGEHHYFGAGSWACNDTSREGVTWHPEYDRPLGIPRGPAVKGEDGVWRRSFMRGTNVSFDSASGKGTIDWAQ